MFKNIFKTKKDVRKRNIYFYVCKGCMKNRLTLFYERASIGLCMKCKRGKVEAIDDRQKSIFDVEKKDEQ